MPILLNEDRKYPRLQHTEAESKLLNKSGFTPVVSSNVSAIARDENGLLVRFHGGAIYRYPDSGDLYDKMLSAPSKGKFVWNELIRKHVRYYRAGSMKIKGDVESRDMMQTAQEQQQQPQGASILATLGLATMVSTRDIIAAGIIASLLSAQDINSNSRQA